MFSDVEMFNDELVSTTCLVYCSSTDVKLMKNVTFIRLCVSKFIVECVDFEK